LNAKNIYQVVTHCPRRSVRGHCAHVVWVRIVDRTPGQKTFTFGKTFAWTYPNGVTRPTDRWREEPRKADLVRTSFNYDLKIVSALAGYLIQTAVAALP
jgi:hypothetical protein